MKKVLHEKRITPFDFYIEELLLPFPHLHSEIEIIYAIKGKSYAYIDQTKYEINEGDIFIVFPNQIHYYEDYSQGEYFILVFSPDILFELKSLIYNKLPDKYVLENPSYKNATSLLSKIKEINGEYSRTAIVGIINELIADLLSKMNLSPRIKTETSILQDVLNYCSENFASNITLEDLAKALHTNKYHISRLLNSNLGINFNTYINRLRILSACNLLKETSKSITDISGDVGFGSIRSFNRAFSQIMNTSPLQYRKNFDLNENL